MTFLFLILKLLVVAFFLVMFIRGSRLVWGIGLLVVTTALLLDALLGTFGQDAVAEELGFFYFLITGVLFAGAAAWMWGVLRPILTPDVGSVDGQHAGAGGSRAVALRRAAGEDHYAGTAFDRRMLYDQIRYRFGPEDVLDLIFDLRLNENDMVHPARSLSETIINVMDAAEEAGMTTELALAVERILTPPPSDHLPRLEKLSQDSPPTVLRHFLLASYGLGELRQMAAALGLDWEQLGDGGKKGVARGMLLYLDRRNRLQELIALLQGAGDTITA